MAGRRCRDREVIVKLQEAEVLGLPAVRARSAVSQSPLWAVRAKHQIRPLRGTSPELATVDGSCCKVCLVSRRPNQLR